MSTVVLLRPYPASRTLRAMERARVAEAVACLFQKDYDGWSRLRKDADHIGEEAARAERWELDCEMARRAAARILEKAIEMAEPEGA